MAVPRSKRSWWSWMIVLASVVSCGHVAERRAIEATDSPSVARSLFSGNVYRGERFERRVFGNLRFVLTPLLRSANEGSNGWSIGLFGPDSTQNLATIATPPYHGLNATVIEAWHFRDKESTAPEEGDRNAPGEERGFHFLMDPRDYERYRSALDRVLWPGGAPESTIDSASAAMGRMPVGEGWLTIREMKLGGLEEGSEPYFEELQFAVELRFPARALSDSIPTRR